VLRRIVEPKRDGLIVSCEEFHSEKLRLHSR
jgi:hypothetical protein